IHVRIATSPKDTPHGNLLEVAAVDRGGVAAGADARHARIRAADGRVVSLGILGAVAGKAEAPRRAAGDLQILDAGAAGRHHGGRVAAIVHIFGVGRRRADRAEQVVLVGAALVGHQVLPLGDRPHRTGPADEAAQTAEAVVLAAAGWQRRPRAAKVDGAGPLHALAAVDGRVVGLGAVDVEA